MKTCIISALFVCILAGFAGCAAPRKDTVSSKEQEFRRQLAESIPVKDYGYTIKDLMFSENQQKALVIFTHPSQQPGLNNNDRRPDWEFTLESNGFRRYRGMTMQPFYTPGTANTPPVYITVVLPEK